MIDKLFVYGTLGPGQPNEHLMTKIGGSWTKGAVRGHLLKTGWAVALGYPALRLDDAAPLVQGHIFQSENLQSAWPELDEFEGAEYQRVEVTVIQENGTSTIAYVYEASVQP